MSNTASSHIWIDSKLQELSKGTKNTQIGVRMTKLLEYVKFEALELVSIVSPLSKLGIMRHLFCWIPYLPRRFSLKIHNFCQPFDQSV